MMLITWSILGWREFSSIEDCPKDKPFKALIEKDGIRKKANVYIHTGKTYPYHQWLRFVSTDFAIAPWKIIKWKN